MCVDADRSCGVVFDHLAVGVEIVRFDATSEEQLRHLFGQRVDQRHTR